MAYTIRIARCVYEGVNNYKIKLHGNSINFFGLTYIRSLGLCPLFFSCKHMYCLNYFDQQCKLGEP